MAGVKLSMARLIAQAAIAGVVILVGAIFAGDIGEIVRALRARASDDAMLAASAVGRAIVYYRHPMGLPDTSPVPKKDSMGMDYIAVYAGEEADPSGTVRISPAKVQRAGIRTEPVAARVLTRSIRAAGTIAADESRVRVVTARFGGFIEELFVAVTGAEVKAGAPLMRVWIESAEILQKQSDLLLTLRAAAAAAGRPGDIERAERNLRQFGIPDSLIEQLRRTGEPVRSIVLPAPAAGTVLDKPAMVGMRFAVGDALFRTADLSTVWVMAAVAERDLAVVRVGQRATVTLKAFPEVPLDGRVAFIYPEITAATRSALVRIELPNPDGRLKTGLYADVAIEAAVADRPVVAIPDSAILDSGKRRVVFVAIGDGLFEPREPRFGRRGDGYVEVIDGIALDERIVVRGNFLIDAESNLRSAIGAIGAAPERP